MKKIILLFISLLFVLLISSNSFAAVTDIGYWLYDGDYSSSSTGVSNPTIDYESFEKDSTYNYNYLETVDAITDSIFGNNNSINVLTYDEDFNEVSNFEDAEYFVVDFNFSSNVSLPVYVLDHYWVVEPNETCILSVTESFIESSSTSWDLSATLSKSISSTISATFFGLFDAELGDTLGLAVSGSIGGTKSKTYQTMKEASYSITNELNSDGTYDITYVRYEQRETCKAHLLYYFQLENRYYNTCKCLGCDYQYSFENSSNFYSFTQYIMDEDGYLKRKYPDPDVVYFD